MKCIHCYKPAVVTAYGNSYCMKCYKKSRYYAEINAKRKLDEEKEAKKA